MVYCTFTLNLNKMYACIMYDSEFTQSIKIPVMGLFDQGQFLTKWVLDLTTSDTSDHQQTLLVCKN